ncbi:NAD(P)/FAD-dependent oxidoreductase [uncultured Parolsenella sp.]|uniref:NAD(P)/FAD-dependent oxidoreductase n=1 Tax=uncultured Parolsenella sp. TaxID=2083008 RepID=UPI002598F323|nr:NAD(P)/FAD-dependent oxidoreductase [uncultured Parolsenella sp.]
MGKDALVQQLVDSYDNWPASRENASEKPGLCGSSARMTQELYPYDRLFSPIKINKLTIKNRIVMAPMGNIDMCEETGRPNDMMLQYFFARAKGGCGLLTTGLVPVSHGIDSTVTELDGLTYFPRIDRSRTVMPGWRDLAQGVHALGSRIFVQLTAGLGRVGNPQCLLTQKKLPVSASFLPNYYIPAIPCMRLSDRKLRRIVTNIGQAAADAHAMGIDGVYLHGHEGYLIEQLSNPAFNHRKLGRYADWRRFGLDMVAEIRRRVGPDYPIMYRIDLSLALEETYDEETLGSTYLGRMRGGRTVEQTLSYMEELVAAGVDVFDVDLGCYDNWWMPHPPASMPAGCFVPVARAVRERFAADGVRSNAGLPVPVVAVGKLGYPDVAERALREGSCDMVMLGRPLLADPEWPNKAFAGRVADIRPCIGCQEGCLNEFVEGGHPQCAVNPRCSFEHLMPESPAPAKSPKRVAVVGAGPAGMVCALAASRRGHTVTLIDASDKLGGKLVAAGAARIKFDVENYRVYLERQVRKQADEGNLTLELGHAATKDALAAARYDAIVCAAGAHEATPPIPGLSELVDAGLAVPATRLLREPELLGQARSVTVIGGGAVGCEVAQWLAVERNVSQVSVVEMLPHMMQGACTANRGHLLHALAGHGVRLLSMTRVERAEQTLGGALLHVSRNRHKNVPDPYVSWTPILPENVVNPLAPKVGDDWHEEVIASDLVVIACGGQADDSLFYELQQTHAAPELRNIGDGFVPGRVLEAVRAAYRLGTTI